MSKPIEQMIDNLENEVVGLEIAFGGDTFARTIAESIVAIRHGASQVIDLSMMAMSPSETVGHPELRIA